MHGMNVIIKPGGLIVLGLGVLAGIALPRFLAKKPTAPGGGGVALVSAKPLIYAGSSAWKVTGTDKGVGEVSIVPIADAPNGIRNALHIEVTQPGTLYDAVAVVRVLPFALKKGQKLAVRFWARATLDPSVPVPNPENITPTAVAKIACMGIKQAKESLRSLSVKQALSPEWKLYELPFVMKEDYPEDGARLGLRVGAAAGTYEFSQLELIAL
jgi:hypothetical protein